MVLTPALRQTLIMVADAVSDATVPWWIIGSAAVALHGADLPEVHDVDLLMSASDAERTLRSLGVKIRGREPSLQFKSDVFGVWRKPPLPVEIFGGFSLGTPSGWHPVIPQTREVTLVDGRNLFAPSARELAAMLLSFGRKKDLERARLLRG